MTDGPTIITCAAMRALYAGSFDPITKGHLNIIERTSSFCDDFIVGVAYNEKKKYLFSSAARCELVRESINEYTQGYLHEGVVKVCVIEGLLADFCNKHDITHLVRGLRVNTDFEYEMQIYNVNRDLCGVETIFLPSIPEQTYISSSMVKELAKHGRCEEKYVTPCVAKALNLQFEN